MIKPMLAVQLKHGNILDYKDWAIEEKFDGHRLIVVHDKVNGHHKVRAFARTGADRPLPAHLVAALSNLPLGIYDGELLSGDTGTDVTRIDLEHERRYVVFDVLELCGRSTLTDTYDQRRQLLVAMFIHNEVVAQSHVLFLARSKNLTCENDVTTFAKQVWNHDGEGAILKRRAARYQAGVRSPDFIKVKRVSHATLELVGFEASRGTVMGRGRFAIVKLRDKDGNETTCKTKNDYELEQFHKQWTALLVKCPQPSVMRGPYGEHPSMGRKLMIEFPRRTRTGGYQGPVIWDRWDNE